MKNQDSNNRAQVWALLNSGPWVTALVPAVKSAPPVGWGATLARDCTCSMAASCVILFPLT